MQTHIAPLKVLSLSLAMSLFACNSIAQTESPSIDALNNTTADNQPLRSLAPRTLAGQDMVLSIQSSSSSNDIAVPTQGVIVQSYSNRRHFSAYGIGGQNHLEAEGRYKYRKTGIASAIEKTIDQNSGQNFITHYNFESENFGSFNRYNADRSITLSGQFSVSASNTPSDQQLAEDNHHGLTVAVNITHGESSAVPKGYYPDRALVLQHYNSDGTYTADGFGPATIAHSGTYSYEKVSANVAVEQTIQVTADFTLPFTMVYFYHTPTSGRWYQDFGNGTIKFSGVFSTYVTPVAE